ncbi:MAG: beta-N-acetylhexosaminidase [Burkholderiales bacterium]
MNSRLGPLMCGIAGPQLNETEREVLLHPMVGGVILFTRNYESLPQLSELTREIHAVRPLLIAVDHEGGRVQRFRLGFTQIPAMREVGKAWDDDPDSARDLARAAGFVLASELRSVGVDLSFTPVLDVDHGQSTVIRDRALHSDPRAIAELAHSLMLGLQEAGMAAVGKHFPGHGFIAADSHLELPVDERSFSAIEAADLIPFARMIAHGLPAIMPAHVVYPAVDSLPAGFSKKWLTGILRNQLNFHGAIFSDDLGMAAACCGGDILDRAELALEAGCDMVLLCNDSEGVATLLDHFHWRSQPASSARRAKLKGAPRSPGRAAQRYAESVARLSRIASSVPLDDPTARNA